MRQVAIFLLLFCSIIVHGQGMRDGTKPYLLSQMQYDGIYVTKSDADIQNEANVYLFPKWEGQYEVFISEKEGFSFPNLNYNVKSNKLESKISKDSVFQIEIEKVNFIRHNSKKYKLYSINGINALFQEIYVSPKLIFVKGFTSVLKKGTINPLTLEYIQQDVYSIVEKYYVKFEGNDFVELKLTKKSILNLFGTKANQVNKYASDSKLNFKSEADLFKIFLYYDKL